MRAVIQRVSAASVISDGVLTVKAGQGLAILLGVKKGDSEEDAEALAVKIAKLRIFCDSDGKMNLSLIDVGGSALVVSNFTLCANYAHGNRPDYLNAEEPEKAKYLYEYFVNRLKQYINDVQTGVFASKMMFSIDNDGPITIVMDSEVLLKKEIR